jgi:hypothetical protein
VQQLARPEVAWGITRDGPIAVGLAQARREAQVRRASGCLLSDDLYQHPLQVATVGLPVEDSLPGAKI